MIVLEASAAADRLLQTTAGQSIEKRIYSRNESLHAPQFLDFSAYDAAYVVLAETLGAALVTRDARLASASGHGVPIELF